MAITVRHLIQQPYMAGVEVICGKENLANRIDGLTFFNDACHNSVSPNNLVLASSEEVRPLSGSGRKEVIEKFVNQKVAALIIKMESGDRSQAEEISHIFQQYPLPVLVFPNNVLVAALIRGINYDIVYSQGYNLNASYEDNCLQDLVCVERDEHSILKLIKMMGICVNEYLCIVLLKPPGRIKLQDLVQSCHAYLGNRGFICSRNGLIMLLLRSSAEYTEAVEQFCQIAEDLSDHLKEKYKNADIVFGVGHTYESQIEIRKSYLCAKTALMTCLPLLSKKMVFYDKMGIYKILYHMRNRKDLYELRNDTVGILQKYDQENRTEYYDTVKAYIDNFYSIRDTSKQLFVQYNTIRYRITKIKEEFGWDLLDRDSCIYLTLGFQAEEFLREDNE